MFPGKVDKETGSDILSRHTAWRLVMGTGIRDLEPKVLFGIFDDLVATPRGSKKEKLAREYCLAWAKKHGFKARPDDAGNVAITVPATKGYEKAPGVIIQGHLDIVWEKTPETAINFETDPIPAWVDGDLIRTRGTTLGADNGIGVAAGMAAAIDPECVHGPLELLLTVDEETGMGGAFGIDPNLVKGRIMLNLDSEEEGTLFVGCCGGGDSTILFKTTRVEKPAGTSPFRLSVSGLRGGHSGLEIHSGRGNSLRILARMATALDASNPPLFCDIDGGTKRNAIPRDASACIFVKTSEVAKFRRAVKRLTEVVRAELGQSDPGLAVNLTPVRCNCRAIAESANIWKLLLTLPHGPVVMSQAIPGLVETSSNMAQITTSRNTVKVLCNSRSMVGSAMEAVRLTIRAAGELAGGQVKLTGAYPGWRPNMDSLVLKAARDLWTERTGTAPNVTAIHAGLECGVIGEKYHGMDMVSFGPEMHGVHSPEENLSIPSTRRFYDFLKALLKKLAS